MQAHDGELTALRNFVTLPGPPTSLLIDTYDTGRAARRVAELDRELAQASRPGHIGGVRIDSGDLAAQARSVRHILDEAQCRHIQIILSGSLDEHGIAALLEAGAPVDAFGVGTRLDVSEDAPSLDMVYKLEEYLGRARRKRSAGKETWPGTKQVFRRFDAAGVASGDVIALAGEARCGTPLLQEVMREGRRVTEAPPLSQSRDYCRARVAELPAFLRSLTADDHVYPVEVSRPVRDLADQLDHSDDR